MGPVLKIGGSLAVLGTVGGGVALAYTLNGEDKSVRNHLKKIGYYVLEDKQNEAPEWKKVFDAYKAKKQGSPSFDTNVVTQEDLIKKCNKLLSNNFESNANYSLIKKWCVKEETIEAMLTRNGYQKIGTATGNNDNAGKWQQKVNAWKADTTSTNKITVTFDGAKDVNLLETACGTLRIGETKTHEDNEFEKKFIQAREWCAIGTTKNN